MLSIAAPRFTTQWGWPAKRRGYLEFKTFSTTELTAQTPPCTANHRPIKCDDLSYARMCIRRISLERLIHHLHGKRQGRR